jgi:O-antigen/teichoic acid export membrane protein
MWQKIKSLLLRNTTTRQTVAKNTFWLTAGTVGSRLVKAILIIYAARVLGAEGYGVFSYTLSLAGFFTIFSDFGLSALLTREAIKKPEKISSYLATTFVIKTVTVALTVLATLIAAPHFTKIAGVRPLIPIAALLLAFDSLRGLGFSITRAQNRMELEGLFTVLTDVFITAFGVIVLFVKPTTYLLTAAYAAGSGVGFVLVAFVVLRQFRKLLSYFDKSLIKHILSSAWPFAIMGLLGGFMINIDTLFIGFFRTAGELGLYGAAQRPIQFAYILPTFFGISLFPVVSNFIHRGDNTKVRLALEKSIVAMYAIAIPLALGSIIIGKQLIYLFFGREYLAATTTFQLLSLTYLLIFPNTIISNTIFAYDKQKIFLISSTLGAAANSFLDWLFIPSYGIAGSAVATIISQILVVGYNWIKMKEINYFKVLPNMPKIIIASIIMSALTFTMQAAGINVILNIGISIASYGALIIMLGEPLVSEIKLILGNDKV